MTKLSLEFSSIYKLMSFFSLYSEFLMAFAAEINFRFQAVKQILDLLGMENLFFNLYQAGGNKFYIYM